MKDLAPTLLVSFLLHLSVAASILLIKGQQVRMGGAPTVSISLIDAVEAHQAAQPVAPPKPPEVKRPATKPTTVQPPPEAVTRAPEKTADDVAESAASLSAAVQKNVDAEPISEASFNADYLHNPKPQYPPLSRRLGEQGRVLLHVQVSAEGQTLAVSIKQSSGFKRLDLAAVDVVKRWQFVPAKQGSTRLTSTVDVPLQFSLEK